VYGREQELGHRVVVIGGSETGVETAAYLSQSGHQVTVLTRGKQIAHDSQPVHYREMFERFWDGLEDFYFYTETAVSSIADGVVTFTDADGQEQKLEADDVVLCGGMQPQNQEAVQFAKVVKYFRMVGDCNRVANVRTATKAAYVAAMLL
jgi:pyruvate/2-oxoglutarate dehydrogenase complex dihydrolipoamide dehydrogenase (E3) component